MIKSPAAPRRDLNAHRIDCDLAVVGGGLAGVCAAVTAARQGLRVTLLQHRPVLGGNASSEVRLWVLGATSHMGNNNRWAREGGLIDEILVENTYRNPEGNALIFDTILLEKVVAEPNLTLLLNTAAFDVEKSATDPDAITALRAFCSQNATMYHVAAPLFCDASGDGTLAFLAGAAFRMGAESRDEFGERFAPAADYGNLLGHTIYFYSKDTGRPVRFVPPAYALKDITQIPRWRHFNAREHGCKLWWIEYGGRLDTVHDTEQIKWELWKVVYGVWNHIKNSGQFPDAANLTLEWVGTIPGKRESRRFEGDYMLTQQDLVEQRRHPDAVSFGGWAIDLHPADGVFSERPGCNQWHAKGVYQIPYRCLYSRNVPNLFLAGRIVSASHVAFGSTRVMATCAANAQAVGAAAALCTQLGLPPRALGQAPHVARLQLDLQRLGQHIPHVEIPDPDDLAAGATVTASSRLRLAELPPSGQSIALTYARAMLLPVRPGPMPRVTFHLQVAQDTELEVELRTVEREGNFTPDTLLARQTVPLRATAPSATRRRAAAAAALVGAGASLAVLEADPVDAGFEEVTLDFDTAIDAPRYVFVCLRANPHVRVATSDLRVTGVLALAHKGNDRVAESATQTPPPDIGVDAFEFWIPERRPKGHNLALRLDPPIDAFAPANVQRGPDRPTTQPNAFVADPADPDPTLTLTWPTPRTVTRIDLWFDTDFDHPMESVLWGHPERTMPFCVRDFRLYDAATNTLLHESTDNHQTRNTITLPHPVTTSALRLHLTAPTPTTPAALFRVRIG